MNRKGFTLIELLVVVAIIGILSSVVLASLSSARNKAKDAAIKQGVAQLANLMALNYDTFGGYIELQQGPFNWIDYNGASCNDGRFTGTYAEKAKEICNDIFKNAGNSNCWGSPTDCKMNTKLDSHFSPTTNYSIMVKLNNGNWYCSGSSGNKGEYPYYGIYNADPKPGCNANP